MRVAHCVHGLGLGGAQKVIAALVRGGGGGGELQHVVYSCDDGVHRAEIEEAGALVRIVPRLVPKLDPLWVVRLARTMRRDGIELVHTHLFGDTLHGYLAARAAGAPPVVATLHIGTEGLTGLQQRGYRWLFPRCARLVACSHAVARSFDAMSRATGAPVTVVPNGIADTAAPSVDTAAREKARTELGASPHEVVLATIGRLEEQKGHAFLLPALARMAAQGPGAVRLVVIGDGALRAALEERARAEGVADRVAFTGLRPDVERLLPAIDVVVFPSLFEGLPIALLEAMAAGRCIVATDIPGIVEAVRPEREALIVPRADVAALAGALARVASDAELRQRLGAAARRRFADEFTAARMVERYGAVYREALAVSGRRLPAAARAG
jgi:glycosyltransferase involved in cell wall biosynthesis